MFFGLIKTKKDKRIIELEEENNDIQKDLDNQIADDLIKKNQEILFLKLNFNFPFVNNVEIEFCPWWRGASMEEVDAAGVWNKGGLDGPYYPGQARIFRMKKRFH